MVDSTAVMCRFHQRRFWPIPWLTIAFITLITVTGRTQAKVTFEKMTNMDYAGTTYYTVRNLSLYECQGWCRDEPDCSAALFSFVVNPLAPVQETTCLLMNETQARKPSAVPQKGVNMFFLNKIHVRSDTVCDRLWSFERVPNRMIKGLDNAIVFTANKEACLAACLSEVRFICRSAEFNYVTLECHLSKFDRRSAGAYVKLVESQSTDYFENACLKSDQLCEVQVRQYAPINIGLPQSTVAHFVDLFYYPDKAFLVSTKQECLRQCSMESQFICRSVLFRPDNPPGKNRCELYHLDHLGYPDGGDTFGTPSPIPLLDSGETRGIYMESLCGNTSSNQPQSPRPPSVQSAVQQSYPVPPPQSSYPSQSSSSYGGGGGAQPPSISHSSQSSSSYGGGGPQPPAPPPSTSSSSLQGHQVHPGTSGQQNFDEPQSSRPSLVTQPKDPSCDDYGVCYDVSIQCTDTQILVFVKTSRPFHGRIYALGRSETCNSNVRNSQQFKLDMSLSGQDCNTQSVGGGPQGGVYTNTIVLQHHNVVLTKADKVYNVKCTYETTSRNVTFGMMPVRDPDTMQITSSPEAPLPKIVILSTEGREASTVRIGDKLTFRIEIPSPTPYGIFARSCVAMAKDARSTFEIIDDRGCPVDGNLFPHFSQLGNALESHYDAFRFTESYGVIFQCNVKYCVGKCDPVTCGTSQDRSWGRRRRRSQAGPKDPNEMTLSREILVLDIMDEAARLATEDPPSANTSFTLRESLSISTAQCASRSSLMALSVTSATMLVIYICTVAYFVAQRRALKGLR